MRSLPVIVSMMATAAIAGPALPDTHLASLKRGETCCPAQDDNFCITSDGYIRSEKTGIEYPKGAICAAAGGLNAGQCSKKTVFIECGNDIVSGFCPPGLTSVVLADG
jgi:hypothetical protein